MQEVKIDVDTDATGAAFEEACDEDEGMENRPLFGDVKMDVDKYAMAAAYEEACVERTSHLLDDITREARERKATKADDAEVPVYLWFEHMFEDGDCAWTMQQQEQIKAQADWMRGRMLSWWKMKVRKSLFTYLKSKYPGLGACNERTKTSVTFVPGHWTQNSSQVLSVWVDAKYEWSLEERDGLCQYRSWWVEQMSICRRDIQGGQDAEAQAADSSWWSWDDGSRPFHWRWPVEYQDKIRDGIPVHFLHKMKPYKVTQGDEKDTRMKSQVIEKLEKVRKRLYIGPGRVESLTSFLAV